MLHRGNKDFRAHLLRLHDRFAIDQNRDLLLGEIGDGKDRGGDHLRSSRARRDGRFRDAGLVLPVVDQIIDHDDRDQQHEADQPRYDQFDCGGSVSHRFISIYCDETFSVSDELNAL